MVQKAVLKSAARMGKAIRDNVRGLWLGHFNVIYFMTNMIGVIETGYDRAWTEGAAQCGITREERTTDETIRLMQETRNDESYILSFADQIEANNKANGGKLTPLLTRAKLWTNRYNAIVTIAQQISCADRKFKWHLGPTEDHCGDCLIYAGRVHRGSVWASVGAAPQSRSLSCGGWNCLCALSPTTDRASGGRPPRPSGG